MNEKIKLLEKESSVKRRDWPPRDAVAQRGVSRKITALASGSKNGAHAITRQEAQVVIPPYPVTEL